MNKSSYDRIQEYCDSEKRRIITTSERDFILRKYLESYFDAITDKSITENEIKTIEQSLLGSHTLESYAEAARNFYDTTQQQLISDFERKHKRIGFIRDLWINILGAFLYSAILFFVYLIAKDQIATWLSEALKTVPK